jgi:pimeloyl-ACP methyl ester carboxylesterase
MRTPRSLRAIYPFRPQFFEVEGSSLHYIDEGTSQGCVPLICLHGNPTWSFYYRDVVRHFLPQRRVLAPDYLGCGLSGPQPRPLCLEDHVRIICEWIQSLKLTQFDLLLHDWGGAIGMGVTECLPKHVRKIALLNSGITPLGTLPRTIQLARLPWLGQCLTQGANAFLRGALLTCTTKSIPKEIQEGYLYPYRSWLKRQAIYQFVRDIPLSPKDKSYAYLTKLQSFLPSLTTYPIHAFWGMKDFVFHDGHLQAWKNTLPNLQIKRYPQAGHWVLEDAKGEIESDLEVFLRN